MEHDMQNQIAVISLGTKDLTVSKKFYRDGFGWTPVFDNEQIAFYQMNGFVLGVFAKEGLAEEVQTTDFKQPAAFTLAHNVKTAEEVDAVMDQLIEAGATLARKADEPPQGGRRGYVADPDGHFWEIAFNPAFPIDEDGHVSFGT